MSEYQRKVRFYFYSCDADDVRLGISYSMKMEDGEITCEGSDYVFVKFNRRPNMNKAFKDMFPIKREQIIRRTA